MWIGVKEINELSRSTLEKKELRKQRQEQLKALGAKVCISLITYYLLIPLGT